MSETVVLIQRIFPQYRKSVYDKMKELYNFFVFHGQNKSGIKTAQASYSVEVNSIAYGKADTQMFLFCLRKLLQYKPDIVIHEFAVGIISLPFVALWCRWHNKKFVLWSHGYNRKQGFSPDVYFLDKYRLWWMKQCDALIVYGEKDKILLSNYVCANKVFVAKNTLDTNKLVAIQDQLVQEGREAVKKRLGFAHQYNIIYIGRLLKEKRPDLLVDAFDFLPRHIAENTTIHFIGDGPFKADLLRKANSASIIFHGSQYDDFKNGSMLYAADLMVMPGDIGLSVNHAFAFLCPVITFKRDKNGPFHGPEEEYIINEETGFLVEEHSAEALATYVTHYLSNDDLQQKMRKKVSEYFISELSIEKMVIGLKSCLEEISEPIAY